MQIGRFFAVVLAAGLALVGEPSAGQDEGAPAPSIDGDVAMEIHRRGWVYDAQGEPEQALSMFGQACEMGLAPACAMAGRLEHELGTNGKDHIRAARMLARACRSGDDDACPMIGIALGPLSRSSSPEPESALALALLAMGEECRHPEGEAACLAAANLLGSSEDVPVDLAQAKKYGQRACAKEAYQACLSVQMLPADPKDEAGLKAQDEMRCRAGFANGCDNLLVPLMNGEAGDLTVLQKACDNEVAIACANLGLLYSHGPQERHDMPLARRYLRQACDGFVAKACFAFGVMHKKAMGGPANRNRSVSLVAHACELGFARACMTLSIIALDEESGKAGGLDANAARARACRLGDQEACSS